MLSFEHQNISQKIIFSNLNHIIDKHVEAYGKLVFRFEFLALTVGGCS